MAYGKLIFIKPKGSNVRITLLDFVASFLPFGVFSSVGIEYEGFLYTGNRKRRIRKDLVVYSKNLYLSDKSIALIKSTTAYSFFNSNCVYKIKPILIENGFGWKWYYRMPNFLYKAVKDKKEMESYWFIY